MCRSVGCILAELLYRKPLFPGKDYIHQLKLIIKTLGSPSDEDLEFISIPKARAFIKAMPRVQVRIALHPHSHSAVGKSFGLETPCSSTLPTSWRPCQQCLTVSPAGCLAHMQAAAAASCRAQTCLGSGLSGRGSHPSRMPAPAPSTDTCMLRAACVLQGDVPGRQRAGHRPAGAHAALQPGQAHHSGGRAGAPLPRAAA